MMYMRVIVKLFGGLKLEKEYRKSEEGDFLLEFAETYRVNDLIKDFGLENKPLIVVINNKICNDYERVLNEGDVISFFPPIAGG